MENKRTKETTQLIKDAQNIWNANKDYNAIALLNKAADMGDSQAFVELGKFFANKLPYEQQDKDRALSYFAKAAALKNIEAFVELSHFIDPSFDYIYKKQISKLEKEISQFYGGIIDTEISCALTCLTLGLVPYNQEGRIINYSGANNESQYDYLELNKRIGSSIVKLHPDNKFRQQIENILLDTYSYSEYPIAYTFIMECSCTNLNVYKKFIISKSKNRNSSFSIRESECTWKSYIIFGWNELFLRCYSKSIKYITSKNQDGMYFLEEMTKCNNDEIKNAAFKKKSELQVLSTSPLDFPKPLENEATVKTSFTTNNENKHTTQETNTKFMTIGLIIIIILGCIIAYFCL